MTLAPGHFHAALVHRDRHPDVDRRVTVYAPDDDDTAAHIARVAAFNARPVQPTDWELDIRAGPDFLDRFLREQPGSAVVIAGRNAPKIDLILAAVRNGCHVLADKPWVIDASGYQKLTDVLREAEIRDVVVSDMMTERHEVTAGLLRDLLREPEIVGELPPGTESNPTLRLFSLHYLMKTVAGKPLRRPAWWFDADVAGTAIADVGTHLADLALWLLFRGERIGPEEVEVHSARAWPTELTLGQFTAMTGLTELPAHLRERWTSGSLLNYQGNGSADFAARGISVRMTVNWASERGPTDRAEGNEITACGTNATITARSVATLTAADRPELVVLPTAPDRRASTADALRRWCENRPESEWGLAVEDRGPHLAVTIPDRIVTPHESHFREVFDGFVRRILNPTASTDPENLLAKYLVTTAAADPAGACSHFRGGAVTSSLRR